MAERKPAKKATQQSANRTTGKASKGFTDEERAAMRERAQELKAGAHHGPRAGKADGESDVLAKIAEMPERDRAVAERLHAVIKASAPALSPRAWYGMPVYAKHGKVVCLLPKRAEVQDEVRDVRLQRQGEPRRRRHVADLLRAEGADRRRREKDRRATSRGSLARPTLLLGRAASVGPRQEAAGAGR